VKADKAKPPPLIASQSRRRKPKDRKVSVKDIEDALKRDDIVYVTIKPHPQPMRDAEDMFPIGLKVIEPGERHVEVIGYGMFDDTDCYVEVKLGGSYGATMRLPPSTLRYEDVQIHNTRYRFTLPNGKKVEGKVQGNGGYLREEVSGLKKLKKAQERAEAGEPLTIYEPKKGHVKVMPYWTVAEDGPIVAVPLKGARIGVAP
jgi:hypothetical protein